LGDHYDPESIYFYMDSCNISSSEKIWTGSLLNRAKWKELGGGPGYYDWLYPDPAINMEFDSKTANISMGAYLRTMPHSNYTQAEEHLQVRVPGYINVTFHGVVDSLRSDVMVNDSDTPAWLRSVGFNNNSLNIQYSTAMKGKSVWGLYMSFSAFLLAPLAFYI
jgi:hypothetical protein